MNARPQTRTRKSRRHHAEAAGGSTKFTELPIRLTAEPAMTVSEDGEVIPGVRFFLDGDPLYPQGVNIFDPEDDEETMGAKIDAYLRSRGVEDSQELFCLIAAWSQFYLAPSYALPSC